MSNRGHHQLVSVGAFAVGVLLVVSSLFGHGQQAGTLDKATDSIVRKLTSQPDGDSGQGGTAYQVTLTSSASVADSDDADDTSEAAPAPLSAPHNPWSFSSPDEQVSLASDPPEQDASVDVGHIYR